MHAKIAIKIFVKTETAKITITEAVEKTPFLKARPTVENGTCFHAFTIKTTAKECTGILAKASIPKKAVAVIRITATTAESTEKPLASKALTGKPPEKPFNKVAVACESVRVFILEKNKSKNPQESAPIKAFI
jgi:hypothetical protein